MENYYNLIVDYAAMNVCSSISVMGKPMYIVQAVSQFGDTPSENAYPHTPSHGNAYAVNSTFIGIIKFRDKDGTELVITGNVYSDVFKHIYDGIVIRQF